MSHAYTEDQLVGQPAIGLFAELGYRGKSQSLAAGCAVPQDAKGFLNA